MRARSLFAGALAAGVMQAASAAAQTSAQPLAAVATMPQASVVAPSLDSLVLRAIAVSPMLHAATARLDAVRARVRPASALPDPMLMLGIINQPLGSMPPEQASAGAMAAEGPEPMTMRMVGVSQMLPFPGKRSLQVRSAEYEVEATQASLDVLRRQVMRDVKAAYYELVFIDQALAIVERSRTVLAGLIAITESRYSVGMAGQQDVLKARVEATRLAQTAAGLIEQRLAMSANLNVLLDQPTETPVPHLVMPDGIARAAVATSSETIRFNSAALGSRAADSPLLPLGDLQDAAARLSPELREQDAMIAAETARIELARKAYLPDVELSLQYGQRGGGLPDMVSAIVSIPVPLFKGRKQDQQIVEANAQLAARQFERRAKANALRGEIARFVTEIERERTVLALLVKAILPQSGAALTSATASYQVGKIEFLTVLENQSAVFTAETEYFRALSDFATKVAELERLVGREVLK